ncbi:hypothetical protein ACVW00_003545 [Marmoricola sp. URHA0025 HA25]
MEVDIGDWAVIAPEPGGREQGKSWVATEPGAARTDHWLWKPRTLTGDGTWPALNDVAEVAASRIAAVMGLPAAECSYARKGDLGVISRNVTPSGYDLHDGDVFLHEIEGYDRRDPQFDERGVEKGRVRSNIGYTLEAVSAVLDGMNGPPGYEAMSALQVFAGYLVLDALIANTDRHPRNWAVLEDRANGRRVIAPTFDHGTALGAGLTEPNRETRDVVAFCRRGMANPFSPAKQTLVELARRATNVGEADFWLERVRALDSAVFSDALQAPQGRLSVEASTFMTQVLTINRERLSGDADDSRN